MGALAGWVGAIVIAAFLSGFRSTMKLDDAQRENDKAELMEDVGCPADTWAPLCFCHLPYGHKNVYGLDFDLLSKADDMAGLQFGLLNAKAVNVYGLQLSGFTCACSSIVGLQFGALFSESYEDVYGVQIGCFGANANRLTGIAFAGVGTAVKEMTGLQLGGIMNKAERGYGLQLGIVNEVKSGYCVQIGLVNITDALILPLVNISWL